MIRLDSTTRKLQIVLAGAITTNQLDVTVSYYDVPPLEKKGFNEYQGVTKVAVTNNTTDVDICAAPLNANTVRNIDTIHVYNKDTVNATVIVKMDDGGTEHILKRHTLTTLQTLFYENGQGWTVL